MKNFRLFSSIILVLGVVIIAAALFFPGRLISKPTPTKISSIKVTERFDFGGLQSNIIATVEATQSATVLDVLQQSEPVNLKQTSYGPMIMAIDGVDGTSKSMYWMLSVNGKMAPVGADQYLVHDGDVVDWQLSK